MSNFEYGPVYSVSFTSYGATFEIESLDRNYINTYATMIKVLDPGLSVNLDGYKVDAKKYLTLLEAYKKADMLKVEFLRMFEEVANVEQKK